MKNLATISGLVLIVAAVGIAGYMLLTKPQSLTSVTASKIVITPTTAQAFGRLSTTFMSATDPNTKNSTPTEQAAGTATSDLKMLPSPLPIVPPATTYRYVYTGSPLQVSAPQLDVLKRSVDHGLNITPDLLNELGLGAADLSTFSPVTVQNISLTQADGYTVYVDGTQGTLSISRTSSVTPMMRSDATATTPTDVPPDASLISIADTFLRHHGITTSAYGHPVVQRQSYATTLAVPATSDGNLKAMPFISDEVTVLYPLLLNGVGAYGLWGDAIGMSVNVSVNDQRVTSVSNLTTRRYASASYPAVTDSATILKVAEYGGVYGTIPVAGTKVIDVKLGTPARVFASMYWNDPTEQGELYVPALRFPVTDAPTGTPSVIVVPLVKDLLTYAQMKIDSSTGAGSSGTGVNGTTASPPSL